MNRSEFLAAAKLEVTTLEVWLEQGWLMPVETPQGAAFSPIDVARARLIRELRHDMGANDAGVDIILHLLDQLHEMRRALELARAHIDAAPTPRARPQKSRPRKPG